MTLLLMSLGTEDSLLSHISPLPRKDKVWSVRLQCQTVLSQLTSVDTARLLDAKSALLPASAMMIFESACRCSSLIHAFAFSSEDWM
jgi:hypothetical protein